ASHTHHGPVLELDNWPDPKKPYVRELERKLAAVMIEADKKLQSAKLGIASKETNLNRNRHSKRKDRPVDSELLVMRVEDPKGKPIAHLVNFAAHPTMIEAKERKFSADYPGVMGALVEKETGAPCLFLQGAAGDLSPNPGPAADFKEFGETLASAVLGLAKKARCTVEGEVALKVRERDFKFARRIDIDNPVVRLALDIAFFPELIDFYQREYKEGVRPHLATALLGGKIGIVGVSGAFFSGHALSL